MKKLSFVLLVIVVLFSCSPGRHAVRNNSNNAVTTPVSGDGSSFDNAVVIKEKSESTGVDAEYTWLGKHYPGYKLIGQSLVFNHKKPYDILDIETGDGNEKKV